MGGATSGLRRPTLSAAAPETVFSVGNLFLTVDDYRVTVGDAPVELTYQEFELLTLLARDAGRIIASDALTRGLWSAADRKAMRRLGVVICRLRQKLAGSWPYRIETVRKRGYGLMEVLNRPGHG